MDLNKCIWFFLSILKLSAFYRHILFHAILAMCNSPTHPNIKMTMKISKTKAVTFKVIGTVPDSEVIVPDLGHADFTHSTRPWVFRFKLILIIHFFSVCVVSAAASAEQACWSKPGVFSRSTLRVNLQLSYNPAGRSHYRLQNHHGYIIKHHHRGMGGSPGDVGEATEGL